MVDEPQDRIRSDTADRDRLDDPIFNGPAIALVFGIAVSTLLTLVVIPVLYFVVYRKRLPAAAAAG